MKKGALSPTTKQKHSIQINSNNTNNSQAGAGDEPSYANQYDQLDEVVAASTTTNNNRNPKPSSCSRPTSTRYFFSSHFSLRHQHIL